MPDCLVKISLVERERGTYQKREGLTRNRGRARQQVWQTEAPVGLNRGSERDMVGEPSIMRKTGRLVLFNGFT